MLNDSFKANSSKKLIAHSSQPIKWGPLSAILVTIGIYFGAQILAGILISLYPLSRHWNYDQTTVWLEHSVVGQFAFIAIVEGISLGVLWAFLRSRGAKPADIGLKRPKWRDLGFALLGFGAYFLLYIAIIQILHALLPGLNLEQKQELGFSTAVSGSLLWLVFISLVILPPLTEEIIMRGFLYTGLKSKLPKVSAAILTSVIFAAAHLQAGSGNSLLWVAAIDTFILSLVLVYLREKTDSLWASIGVHMIKNGIAFTALFILHV